MPQPSRTASRLGPYRLLERLGEGGSGEVWVAERDGADFRQRVAVKLLRARGSATSMPARFRLERRILARLSHPGIARLLDGGATEDGTPWLAMELVDGLSLTEHCTSRGLTIEGRLRLFAAVCEAVQFAHRNLVVHRDLKPSNILVSAAGEPKLLDFGIARLLETDPDDDAPPDVTRTGERPMTLEYAAPEQVRGERATTASDVWALGVILHELLAGVRPYGGGGGSVGSLERAILDAVPSRPSTHAHAPSLRRRLRGDLDAIVLKALRARPEDRYPSVEALAADVRRHLDGLPVAARGETGGYLLRSFVRRYRIAVNASALGVTVVLAGLGGTLWEAHNARQEARKAEQVQDFLLGLLQGFDSPRDERRPVQERDILLLGEERLQTELSDRPDMRAKLWRAFGQTWFNLGAYDRAKPDAERAIALARDAIGPRTEEEGQALLLLSRIEGVQRENLDECTSMAEQACSILRERRGPTDLVAASACASPAEIWAIRGDFARAERISAEQVALTTRVRGVRDPQTLVAKAGYALVLGEWGRLNEAVDLLREIIPLLAETLGPKHEETLLARHDLCRFLIDLGQTQDAEPTLHQVEHDAEEVYGPRYGQLALFRKTRARALDALGRHEEALFLLGLSLELWTHAFGPRSDQLASSLEYQAAVLRHMGRTAEAEQAARSALDMHVSLVGESFDAARTRSVLGSVLLDEGRADEGRAELSRALATQERVLWPGHPDTAATRAELARADAIESAGSR